MGSAQAASPPHRDANLFDILRIVAAAAVIVGHAWPLTGLDEPPRLAGVPIHHLGVHVFFVISGFLLQRSLLRDRRVVPFLVRRAARIVPALVVVVLVTVLALGPAVTTSPDYWASDTTWRYLLTAVLLAQYELPGVFSDHPVPVVNGSLWSLGPEVCCYLVLAVLALLAPRLASWLRAVLAAAVAVVTLVVPLDPRFRVLTVAVVCFAIGSMLAELPRDVRMPVWPGLVATAALVVVPIEGAPGLLAIWLVVPYLVVSVGVRRVRGASLVRRLGDPSYGIYLWGFPVQQLLVAWQMPLVLDVLVAIVVSAALGYASWHGVERHAIVLGRRLSARATER